MIADRAPRGVWWLVLVVVLAGPPGRARPEEHDTALWWRAMRQLAIEEARRTGWHAVEAECHVTDDVRVYAFE